MSFEGGEGAGKSTQIRLLAEYLRTLGLSVVTTREPGGSAGAEALRHVLLSGAAESFGIRMEALLFAAARADHIDCVIAPALAKGEVVLCDRFVDSSRVYQGVTGNLEPDLMDALERVSVRDFMPDLTFMLDLPAIEGLGRARARAGLVAQKEEVPDRFEREEIDVHEKRRQGFLDIAAQEPARCHVVDARQTIEAIAKNIRGAADALLVEHGIIENVEPSSASVSLQ